MRKIMKTIIKILFLFLIFSNNLLSADETCGISVICPNNIAYPYIMCDPLTGKVKQCCITDPINGQCTDSKNNVYGPARKASIPICLDFDNSGPTGDLYGYVCGGHGVFQCYSDIIYKIADFNSNASGASYRWNCLCGKENETCDQTKCKIKVKFIDKNQNEFGNPVFSNSNIEPVGISLFTNNPPDASQIDLNDKCKPNCQNITMYLNNTPEFTGMTWVMGADGTTGHYCCGNFFFIDQYEDAGGNLAGCAHISAFDLKDILTYELGRILGLGDGEDCTVTSSDPSSIMDKLPDGDGTRKNLSQNDKCMFTKLYCPDVVITNIENNETPQNNIGFFPNPTDKLINFTFNVDNETELVTIKIYNSLGIDIINPISKVYNKGKNIEKIDLTSGNTGIYFYTISTYKNVYSGKIILEK